MARCRAMERLDMLSLTETSRGAVDLAVAGVIAAGMGADRARAGRVTASDLTRHVFAACAGRAGRAGSAGSAGCAGCSAAAAFIARLQIEAADRQGGGRLRIPIVGKRARDRQSAERPTIGCNGRRQLDTAS
ncbi:hypothetical protein D7S86_03445 [Pararobbsia silviterrae]|uniref:Uncharacterized protein n=1 Tax=Pararobbsia silviterrae TaxID=1792498 RepID=A0A494YF38_9BURK|nr:hypothetical protein D7S86_03445 [Pararobbsia silviterrae]